MKKSKAFAAIAAAALLLTGCATTGNSDTPSDKVDVLVPKGATALSLLNVYNDKHVKVNIVEGTDILTSEMAKEDSKYDVIIAPINLGAKMIEKGNDAFMLHSVLTWGNLYVVGSDGALSLEGELAAFGENTVPQKVLENALDVNTITPKITYFNAVGDAQAEMLSGKANVALLAEPAATATIAKGKESGKDYKVLADLQKEYAAKNKTEHNGYPQAAIFVKKGRVKSAEYVIKKVEKFTSKTVKKNPNVIAKQVKKVGAKKLGVPNEKMAQNTWSKLNIHVVKAKDAKKDVEAFLKLFDIKFSDEMISK